MARILNNALYKTNMWHSKVLGTQLGMISNFATGSLSSLFIIVFKFDMKIVWNMKIGCGLWGPPLCRHLPTTTIGIISTLQNFRTKNNIPHICYKSLWKWKFYWWVDFRIYDGVPPFLEWIWRNPVVLSIGGEFKMSAHHMMGFHRMMCVLPIKW